MKMLEQPGNIDYHVIHLVIPFDEHAEWVFSTIYNAQSLIQQKNLSHDLSGISGLNFPRLIVGDINTIVFTNEQIGNLVNYYTF